MAGLGWRAASRLWLFCRAAELAALLAALLFDHGARAGPADAFGLGTRARAMGGAASASVSDYSASYYNPARLVYAGRLALAGGYFLVSHDLAVDGAPTPIDDLSTETFGLVANGSLLELPMALGLAATLDGRRLTRLGEVRAGRPEWVRYKSRNRALLFTTNLALRPLPWLAFGGGMSFLASSEGSFQVRGTLVQGEPGAEYDSELEHAVAYDLTRRLFPQFGVSVEISPALSLGLTYHEEREIGVSVEAVVLADIETQELSSPGSYRFTSRSTDGFIPRDVTLGAAYDFGHGFSASVDLTWAQWSRYPTPLATTTSELSLNRESGVAIEMETLPARLSAHDVVVPRLGVELVLLSEDTIQFPLRAGYYFEDTPLEEPTGTSFVDAPRHVLSAGAGVVLGAFAPAFGTLTLGADLSWSLFTPTSIRHTEPAASTCCTESRATGTLTGAGVELGLSFD